MIKTKKGFTLIELLIVIVIIGILAVIVVGLVATNSKNRANDARKKALMRETQTALEQYFVDQSVYPTQAQFPAVLVPSYMATDPTAGDNVIDGDTMTYTPANPAASYTLTIPLKNQNDSGPGVTGNPKVYQLTSKQ